MLLRGWPVCCLESLCPVGRSDPMGAMTSSQTLQLGLSETVIILSSSLWAVEILIHLLPAPIIGSMEKGATLTSLVSCPLLDAERGVGGRRFDVVYTGLGALVWLPDLSRWVALGETDGHISPSVTMLSCVRRDEECSLITVANTQPQPGCCRC